MTLSIHIDRETKRSLYRQIAEQIKTKISNGSLPAGARLPTVRRLATQMGVTRLTIQSAYGELQADGWIESVVGRGTFVSQHVQPQELRSSIGHCLTVDGILSDLLEINTVIGVRSMAIAEPDKEFFPIDEFWTHLTRLRPKAADLFGYSPPQGDQDLRVELVAQLQEEDIQVEPDEIMITSGVMHCLNLVTRAILEDGDHIIIEQPTFIGYLNILKSQGLRPLHVPLDQDGPDLEHLEYYMREFRPKLYYTIPNFQNPTGISFTQEKRDAILKLAHKYNVYILEDDIYGRIRYEGQSQQTLKSQDTHDQVIYTSGLSKALMPGLRVGYLTLPEQFAERLLTLRRANDLCGSAIMQRSLAHFLRDGGLKRHLRRTLPIYRQRRDTLMAAMSQHLPSDTRWTRPQGGFSTWVTLPRYLPEGELYRRALHRGFAFTAGEAYQINSSEKEHLRLCFGNQTSEGIAAGVTILAEILRGA